MPRVFRIGINTFRTLNGPLSGELHVKSGSSHRRGARSGRKPAKGASPMSCAGSDDGDGPPPGGSANTSAAHATAPNSCADSASTPSPAAKRALKEGEQWAGRLEYPEAELQPARPLAKDGYDFVKEINLEVQVAAVAKRHLMAEDEKVSLKILQQLLTLAFGRNARSRVEKSRRYIDDLPGPDSE